MGHKLLVSAILCLVLLLFVKIALASHSADLNGDGRVDTGDLNILKSQWGGSGTADLNHDGMVAPLDVGILLSAWGDLPGDNDDPTVTITSPSGASTVNGTVPVAVTAIDTGGVSRVELYLDNHLHATDTAAPYVFAWDTRQGINSQHMLTAFAYDNAGNYFSHQVEVIVRNTGVDTTPPTVSFDTPSTGATVSGTTTIRANASDAGGLAWVRFYIDSKQVASSETSPYRYTWNTISVPNGIHYLSLHAKDRLGHSSHAAMTVTVDNSGARVGIDQVRLSWNDNPKSTVVVQWRSLKNAPSTVKYGLSATNLTQTVTGSSQLLDGAYQHQVKLSGLTAGTRYYYSVDGGSTSESFKTAPSLASGLKFVAVADQGFNAEAEKLVARMALEQPDFWIPIGDLSYMDRSPFCTYAPDGFVTLPEREYCVGSALEVLDGWMNMNQPLWSGAPTALVLGNHEGGPNKAKPYLDRFATPAQLSGRMQQLFDRTVYSFDYGPIHFIVLNSNGEADERKLLPGQPHYQWLENDLATHTGARWTIVVAHHSPFGSEQSGNVQNIIPLIDQYDVDFVLTASTHLYERSFPMKGRPPVVTDNNPSVYNNPDPVYVIVGSGGNRLMGAAGGEYLPPVKKVFLAKRQPFIPVFTTWELGSDGKTMTVKAIDVNGTTVDQFTVTKP